MRADARRNAEKLRTAAAELFHEEGLDVPLKEIARRAGVSHGTLYNLFGTREALIDEVVTGLAGERLGEVAREALAREDAWDGFAYYVETLCELQVTDPALRDVVTGRYPGAGALMTVCARTRAVAEEIIGRARDAGALRADFTGEDLVFVFASNSMLSRAVKDGVSDASRRNIAFLLDGLRAEAAHPLPVGPVAHERLFEALSGLVQP